MSSTAEISSILVMTWVCSFCVSGFVEMDDFLELEVEHDLELLELDDDRIAAGTVVELWSSADSTKFADWTV
jgi:hypothetical protein